MSAKINSVSLGPLKNRSERIWAAWPMAAEIVRSASMTEESKESGKKLLPPKYRVLKKWDWSRARVKVKD